MKIIKTSKWYDPEGLNIPNDDVDVLYQGNYTACLAQLKNMRDQKEKYFSDRDDIDVSPIQNDEEYEYFVIYYISAIAKTYFSIVK